MAFSFINNDERYSELNGLMKWQNHKLSFVISTILILTEDFIDDFVGNLDYRHQVRCCGISFTNAAQAGIKVMIDGQK